MDDISTVAAALRSRLRRAPAAWRARALRLRRRRGGSPAGARGRRSRHWGSVERQPPCERVQAVLARTLAADQRSSRIGRVPSGDGAKPDRKFCWQTAGGARHEASPAKPVPHESAAATSPARRSTPTICSTASPACCTPGRCWRRTRTRWCSRSMLAGALTNPEWSPSLTGDDVPGEGDSGANRHDEPLFPERDAVPSAAGGVGAGRDAGSRHGEARARVRCEYEPLPADPRPSRTRSPPAAFIPARCASRAAMRRGDCQRARIGLDGELRIGGQEHFYLETQCAIAWLDESGRHHRRTPPRSIPAKTQESSRACWAFRGNSVTVECLRMGGAFGGKEVQANPWAAIAALGAWKTRRPVRVRLPRALDMALTGKRHPFLARYHGRLRRRRAAARRAHLRFIPMAAGASIFPSRCCGAPCSTATTPTCCRRWS